MNIWLVHHVLYLFMSQLLQVLIVFTHRGIARLSYLGGWLGTKMVYPPSDGHPSKY